MKVTIGASPTIPLGDYQFLKPSASLVIDIPDNVDDAKVQAQLDRAKVKLRQFLYQATVIEVGFVDELTAALEKGGLEGLAAHCLKQVSINTKKGKTK